MANQEINDLTAAAALTGTEIFHGVQSANSRKITINQVADYTKAFIALDDETVNYDVVDADLAGGVVKGIDNGSAITVTVLNTLTGTQPCTFWQKGAGQVEFIAGSGVTINSASGNRKLRVRYSAAVLIPLGSNTYLLAGDLDA